MIRVIRFDRGSALARPKRAADGSQIFEGVAGREHTHGDGLEYPTGVEYRDADEVRSIAAQLSRGVPFTVDHPASMPASADRNARIAGAVIGGRVDGPNAIAIVRIDDRFAQSLIAQGHRELSLGYATELDDNKFQRNIRVDHLALVATARCGAQCSFRADSLKGFMSDNKTDCGCNKTNNDQDLELAARERMKARLTTSKSDGDPSRFANVSSTGSTFYEEIRALTGAYDVPSDAIARMAMAARTANKFIVDDTERAARIRAHVVNGIKKLQESAKQESAT